jgi:hypothetical protein
VSSRHWAPANADAANEVGESILLRHGPTSHGGWQWCFCCIRAAGTRREKLSAVTRNAAWKVGGTK